MLVTERLSGQNEQAGKPVMCNPYVRQWRNFVWPSSQGYLLARSSPNLADDATQINSTHERLQAAIVSKLIIHLFLMSQSWKRRIRNTTKL